MKKLIFCTIASLYLVACQKEIIIDLNTTAPQIIIEASISDSTNATARVKISQSVNFSDANIFPAVPAATVLLTEGTNTYTLTETTTQGTYIATNIPSGVGKTFALNITTQGKTYTAQSTIPAKVSLQGIRPQVNANNFPPGAPLFLLFPLFTDALGLGNNYRFVINVNGIQSNELIVQNDNGVDGLPNARPIFTIKTSLKQGDTVQVQMQCLDKPVYDYFYALNQISGNAPGGGTTTANPVSNIKGGALGVFSAYSTSQQTVVIP
jgi:hypothetical protein